MLLDTTVRIVAFLVGILMMINGISKLIFATKIKKFYLSATYMVSGCINLLSVSLFIYLAPQGKFPEFMSYAVIVVAILVAVIGIAQIIFASKFKELVSGSKFYVMVSALIGLFFSLLLIYLAV